MEFGNPRRILRAACRAVIPLVLFFGAILRPLGAASHESVRGVDAQWRCYVSPNFELYSRQDDPRSRQLLHDLEMLRAAYLQILHVKEVRPTRLTVFYFDDEKTFAPYAAHVRVGANVAAFYFANPDRSFIVVAPEFDPEEQRRTIFHEYTHHLQAIIGERPPLWYGEAMAELFSTIEEDKKDLVLGRAVPQHIEVLRYFDLMSLDELFGAGRGGAVYDETVRVGILYAESWALVHYWYFGKSDLTTAQADPFLKYLGHEGPSGNPATRKDVFERSFGMDYAAMQKRLKQYITNGHFREARIPKPAIADVATYAVRRVSTEETRRHLVELDLRANLSPSSKLAVIEYSEQFPADPHYFEALGSVELQEGHEDQARAYWDKALARGSTNVAMFHALATLEYRRWYETFDPLSFRLPDERATRLRDLLQRSIEAAPAQSDGYEMLAWVEATAQKPSIPRVTLVEKNFPHLHRKDSVLLALTIIRMRMGDPKTAHEILAALEERGPSQEIRDIMGAIRKRYDAPEATADAQRNTTGGSPEPVNPTVGGVRELLSAGKTDAAREMLDQLMRSADSPEDRAALFALGGEIGQTDLIMQAEKLGESDQWIPASVLAQNVLDTKPSAQLKHRAEVVIARAAQKKSE